MVMVGPMPLGGQGAIPGLPKSLAPRATLGWPMSNNRRTVYRWECRKPPNGGIPQRAHPGPRPTRTRLLVPSGTRTMSAAVNIGAVAGVLRGICRLRDRRAGKQ